MSFSSLLPFRRAQLTHLIVSEAKLLRREIIRVARDYDIEWKGELDNLSSSNPAQPETNPQSTDRNNDKKRLNIDKTIDEADELASRSEEQRNKEKAAQRKGEAVEDSGGKGEGRGGKEHKSGEDKGQEKAERLIKKT